MSGESASAPFDADRNESEMAIATIAMMIISTPSAASIPWFMMVTPTPMASRIRPEIPGTPNPGKKTSRMTSPVPTHKQSRIGRFVTRKSTITMHTFQL